MRILRPNERLGWLRSWLLYTNLYVFMLDSFSADFFSDVLLYTNLRVHARLFLGLIPRLAPLHEPLRVHPRLFPRLTIYDL